MNTGYLLLVAVAFAVLAIISQRIEDGRKRPFRWFIGFVLVLLMIRGNLLLENLLGFGLGLVVSFVFWLFVGRYNPVGSSDEIKVFGMDD